MSELLRPSFDDYYMAIARTVALRGECSRAKHGAVIVNQNSIVATGYNGAPSSSKKSCLTGDCPRAKDQNQKHSSGSYDLCLAIHAEANALLRASWDGMNSATIYVTGLPCPGCWKLICGTRISRCVYDLAGKRISVSTKFPLIPEGEQ